MRDKVENIVGWILYGFVRSVDEIVGAFWKGFDDAFRG